jgi:aminoglycoside phosphotransferase family enzyme/adenylate kinase family enzyme
MSAALDAHRTLVAALLQQLQAQDPAARLVETHISSVILAGDRAWKLKKPVDFGFLNFTDLAQRIHFCHEELRLNRTLGGGLYLDVALIRGTPEAPRLDGEGEVLEAAVVMRRFPDGAQLDQVLTREGLPLARMDELADRIAAFHAAAPRVGMDSPLGEPATVYAPMAQNFEQIKPLLDPDDAPCYEQLERLRLWTEAAYARLASTLATRKRGGFVRELHGDMHLGNMALVDDAIVIFDAIEFNDSFRWIDVMSELAFLLMDLEDRGLPAHAHRLLNRYLEHTGDYAGLALLRFYQTYRAMVRAKVALLGVAFGGTPEQVREARTRYARYVDLAERYTQPGQAQLLITHGYSGSGKSHAALILAESRGLIRIRSDIERQRLFPERGEEGLFAGRYSPQATEQTYTRLLALAEEVIQAGFGVILDATYLAAAPRQAARALAERLGAPFHILAMHCPEDTLRQRLLARARAGGDPSEATLEVLTAQQQRAEPLDDGEKRLALPMRCDAPAEGQIAEMLPVLGMG